MMEQRLRRESSSCRALLQMLAGNRFFPYPNLPMRHAVDQR